MLLKQELSYLIDFLQSLSLIYESQEWEDGKETILDKVLPSAYQEQIKAYVTEIGAYQADLACFVGSDYNLLLRLALNQSELSDYQSFQGYVDNLSKEQFLQILAKQFSKGKETFSLSDLQETDLTDLSKWSLAILLEEFEQKKAKLCNILPDLYRIYLTYAQALEQTYGPTKEKLLETLGSENLYQMIFKDLMSEEDFGQIEHYLVLYLSANHLVIRRASHYSLVGLGLFVYDYYLEKTKQLHVDKETLQTVLKVLADQTRYGIINCISNGITSNKAIAEKFGISPSGVTYQMKFLLEANIIQRDSKTRRYSINHTLIKEALLAVLTDLDIPQ